MGKNKDRRNIVVAAILIFAISMQMGWLSGFGIDPLQIPTGNIFNPVTGDTAPQKFTLYKRGTSTALAAATVYAWYDWDGDGAVDLGAYPEGEIEELTSATTTGLVTTVVEYPIGADVLYQVHLASYEVETFARSRDSLPSAYDGSALVVPSCYLTLTNTYTSLVRVAGVGYLVTSSTDYNYTLNGDKPEFIFEATAVSTDAGNTEQAYTHWGTGIAYAGTVVAITCTNQDFIDLGLIGSGFSDYFVGATNTICWFNTAGWFDDADITGDSVFELAFELSITAAGDIATIGIYQGMEQADLNVGALNTPIATVETDLDIVA